LKWCPKFSTSDYEVGLLGVVSALGWLEIYSIPIMEGEEGEVPIY
jgi:hypothetical protein